MYLVLQFFGNSREKTYPPPSPPPPAFSPSPSTGTDPDPISLPALFHPRAPQKAAGRGGCPSVRPSVHPSYLAAVAAARWAPLRPAPHLHRTPRLSPSSGSATYQLRIQFLGPTKAQHPPLPAPPPSPPPPPPPPPPPTSLKPRGPPVTIAKCPG